MKRCFGEHAHKLAVSSTKSMTGHLLGAAGGIEAVFTVLAMRDQVAPPTINLRKPDPECDLDYVPNTARKMTIRVALSNSFGFGGTNGTPGLRARLEPRAQPRSFAFLLLASGSSSSPHAAAPPRLVAAARRAGGRSPRRWPHSAWPRAWSRALLRSPRSLRAPGIESRQGIESSWQTAKAARSGARRPRQPLHGHASASRRPQPSWSPRDMLGGEEFRRPAALGALGRLPRRPWRRQQLLQPEPRPGSGVELFQSACVCGT